MAVAALDAPTRDTAGKLLQHVALLVLQSQQLLSEFEQYDQMGRGVVTKHQFDRLRDAELERFQAVRPRALEPNPV